MESLNIDCLIEILKFLPLKDQIKLYQLNGSLQTATTTLWLIKFKHVHINFLETSMASEDFGIFLNCIKDSVELMQLRFLNQHNYEVMKSFCFQSLKTFRFTLEKPYFLEDNDLKDLQTMMPNLQAFSPHGNLSGLYMCEWPMLKELNLSFCFKVELQHFQTILSRLKLEKLKLNIFPNNNQFEQLNLQEAQVENLKYLELNTYEFYYFLAKPLKALKQLIITNHYNPRQLFDVLLSIWQAKDICRIETSNVNNILMNCLEMHMNIEQLSIVNDEYPLPAHAIPSLHQLTELRTLRFKSCNINVKDFINLLKMATQLVEISCENCQFDKNNLHVEVLEVICNRTKKLKLNMYENRLMDNADLPVWRRGQEVCVAY